MKLSKLPASTRIGVTASHNVLVELLQKECVFAGSTCFTHYTIVEGGKSSCRVFFFSSNPEAVELMDNCTPQRLAQELAAFASRQARYPEDDSGEHGWELRRARVDDKPVVIAWATWIKRGSL